MTEHELWNHFSIGEHAIEFRLGYSGGLQLFLFYCGYLSLESNGSNQVRTLLKNKCLNGFSYQKLPSEHRGLF